MVALVDSQLMMLMQSAFGLIYTTGGGVAKYGFASISNTHLLLMGRNRSLLLPTATCLRPSFKVCKKWASGIWTGSGQEPFYMQ